MCRKRQVKPFFACPNNAILASLPQPEWLALAAHVEMVSLSPGEELFFSRQRLGKVYFPCTAIVSLVYLMADGAGTEVAMVGNEGVVGMSLFSDERATNNALVQSGGLSYCLRTSSLRDALVTGGRLPELLMRYANSLLTQMAITTVGSQHSSVEQKLCRWLLDRLDRSASNEMAVTHESIALMLGVRRESITGAAGKLQQEGLIQNRRGLITIADRSGLEDHAGECYQAARMRTGYGSRTPHPTR